NIVGRVFLYEMDPSNRLLGECRPPADEVDQGIIGEDRSWLSLQEELGHIATTQPGCIVGRDFTDVGRFALDRYFTRPCEGRPSSLSRLCKRPPVLCHFHI